MQNPYLHFENVARLKCYLDSVGYTGLILVASNNTKVKPRLNLGTQWGCHLLGSTLDLSEVEVYDRNDIDEIFGKFQKKKAMATQVRAILAKV